MAQSKSRNGDVKDCFVAGSNSEGMEFRGALLKMTRLAVVFEMHNPAAVLRFSESLHDFKIVFNGRELYTGKAVVRNLMNTGPAVVVCEVTLNEGSWSELSLLVASDNAGQWREEFKNFLGEWEKLYKVRPEYKLVLADMQTYLANLRLWLDELEIGIRLLPMAGRKEREEEMMIEISRSSVPAMQALFDQFEEVARQVEPEMLSAHFALARRQLLPLVSCSPFFNRCYAKPLGYAGDYEMVNMMLRQPFEGASLFAKVLNSWFLEAPPCVAHRNRIDYLVKNLVQFTLRMMNEGRRPRIITVGCGPAQEVQRFLATQHISSHADISMLDFNEETLRYTGAIMADLKSKHGRATNFRYIKKSVHHILKEGGRTVELPEGTQYDFVYCAGLFDYLSDTVCKRLVDIMWEWVTPGGLLVVTNVAAHNPSIGWMEHVTDWHLIYRDARQMADLIPASASRDNARVLAEPSTVNIFLEVEKDAHA